MGHYRIKKLNSIIMPLQEKFRIFRQALNKTDVREYFYHKRSIIMAEYHLDDSVTQPFWDNSVEPRLEINAGDTVGIECAEPTGQVTPNWTAKELGQIDFSKIHAL